MTKSELIFFPRWTAGRAGYAERMKEVFHDHLRSKSLIATGQRDAILAFLLGTERHVSLEDIYGALKSRGIGRVTVFRTLKLLEQAGLVEGIRDSRDRFRYELKRDRPHHDHLVCVKCGRMIEVQWPAVERAQEQTCRQLGFEVLSHRHEVLGRCRECVG